jgi:hypothetical protein
MPTLFVPPFVPPLVPPPKKQQYGEGKLKAYNVYVKSRKRKIKLNKVPLSRSVALSLGSYIVDNSTARTFKLEPTPGAPKDSYFRKVYWPRIKHKFRKPIRHGQTVFKKDYWIEKSKHAIDTVFEKRQLSAARVLAMIYKGKKKSRKRKH